MLSEPQAGSATGRSSAVALQSGYAAIDAMAALLILAISIVFSLQATQQARVAADLAWESRRAQTLLGHLIATTPRGLEITAGDSDGFGWRVEMQTTGAERPIAICRRAIHLQSISSRRVYKAATLEVCPVETPA